jgi:hypothetical protein
VYLSGEACKHYNDKHSSLFVWSTNEEEKTFTPGANVIKLFAAVIYHHSRVIPSFCVIRLITMEIAMEWQ